MSTMVDARNFFLPIQVCLVSGVQQLSSSVVQGWMKKIKGKGNDHTENGWHYTCQHRLCCLYGVKLNLDFFPVFASIDAYVVYIYKYIYIRWKVQFRQGFA